MQRKDVERIFVRNGCVPMDVLQKLLDRAERAEAERDALQGQLNDLRNGWANSVKAHADALAERDAAFAAGQKSMRERAAEEAFRNHEDGRWTLSGKIRALPIKDSPDGR